MQDQQPLLPSQEEGSTKYTFNGFMAWSAEQLESIILTLISGGSTYEEISSHLITLAGQSRGLSSRSLRRFCSERGIRRRSGIDDARLEAITTIAIALVGHGYGRRTMHGLLASHGIHVSQSRVAAAMERVAPVQYVSRRADTQTLLNPVPYHASYYGEKLHMDQNEKCVMYGITHVLAIDGYSRKIVGFITIPKKNPIMIYDLLFRPLLLTEGLWNQVRVDHGTEFALVITAQLYLSSYRQSIDHQPVLQSLSRQNHRAERIWREVNQRVNYPIKWVLVEMENNGEIDMDNEVVKFCVSWIAIRVIQDATETFIASWNNHRIPGPNGGIPNALAMSDNHVTQLDNNSVLSAQNALQLHEQHGSTLQRDCMYGSDPLRGHLQLQQLRERDFYRSFPDFRLVFHNVLHGDGHLLKNCIHHFITLTDNFSTLI